MGLFGPPNVEKLEARGDLDGLIRAAGNRDPAVQEQALEALARSGAEAIETLEGRLRDPYAFQRQGALELLERLGWEPTTDDARVSALIALDRWDEIAEMGDPAAPSLIAALADGGRGLEVRTAAAAALGLLGSRAAVPALAEVVEREQEQETLAIVSLHALARLGGDAAQRLTVLLTNEGASLMARHDTVYGLGVIGPEAVEPLLRVISGLHGTESRHDVTWPNAAAALAGTADPRALKVFQSMSAKVGPVARWTAEVCLDILASPPDSVLAGLSRRGVGEKKVGTRMISAMAAGNLRAEAAVPRLAPLLEDDEPVVRFLAMNALGKIGGAAAAQALVDRLPYQPAVGRILTMIALGEIDDPVAGVGVESVRTDPDFAVRAVAAFVAARAPRLAAVDGGPS